MYARSGILSSTEAGMLNGVNEIIPDRLGFEQAINDLNDAINTNDSNGINVCNTQIAGIIRQFFENKRNEFLRHFYAIGFQVHDGRNIIDLDTEDEHKQIVNAIWKDCISGDKATDFDTKLRIFIRQPLDVLTTQLGDYFKQNFINKDINQDTYSHVTEYISAAKTISESIRQIAAQFRASSNHNQPNMASFIPAPDADRSVNPEDIGPQLSMRTPYHINIERLQSNYEGLYCDDDLSSIYQQIDSFETSLEAAKKTFIVGASLGHEAGAKLVDDIWRKEKAPEIYQQAIEDQNALFKKEIQKFRHNAQESENKGWGIQNFFVKNVFGGKSEAEIDEIMADFTERTLQQSARKKVAALNQHGGSVLEDARLLKQLCEISPDNGAISLTDGDDVSKRLTYGVEE